MGGEPSCELWELLGTVLLNLDRKQLRLIVGPVTGYGLMKKHLKLQLGIATRPYVPVEDTPLHLIVHYRSADELRSKILAATFLSAPNLEDIEVNRPYTLQRRPTCSNVQYKTIAQKASVTMVDLD